MEELFAEFVKSLKKRFGNYDESQHRFEKSSNSEIARELGYSDAQFSRLINGSATEGEYQRANQNLNRLLLIDKLESQIENYKKGKTDNRPKQLFLSVSGILLMITFYFAYLYFQSDNSQNKVVEEERSRDSTLRWAFENSDVKPYVNLDDLPNDCNYPCYKYQGKWTLDNSYKLPFFREQNGYHYLATDVTMYARCISEGELPGSKFEGYEYQRHEIWYDKRELPVDSFIQQNGEVKTFYSEMDLAKNEHFVMVASVHTLFRNEFTLIDSSIARTGKVIGRDVETVPDDKLLDFLDSRKQVDIVKSNISRIASNRLEDFSKPVSCDMADAPAANFNDITDGDIMGFACRLTTSRVPFGYEKRYRLADQYIKNTCRPSED